MAHNFITNHTAQKTLKGRLNTLISISDELKFLVGYFYFSGWKELHQKLIENEKVQVKILIGLQVEKLLHGLVEHGLQEEGLSQDDVFGQFMTSLGYAINNEEMDTEAFYSQVQFFLETLESGRLKIRKTENPNHAKLYLFRLNEHQANLQNMVGQFVTGSSNLTKSGLSGQEEFNVEIKDYGFEDAEAYFDELWEKAIDLSEIDQRRKFLIEFIRHKSQAATVTPFEAYVLILKTYLDLQQQKQIKPEVERLLEEKEFKKYSYQIDAVNQALSIIDEYNGVIIADVVGLGKSIIASLIAKSLGKRGMVICPPALIGDKIYDTGWWGYIHDFKLFDWDVQSRGILVEIADNIDSKDIEVVIVDEAHNFRNQDTDDYEALSNICRNRIVILLTATPFNNTPADIFSLLKLFIVPGKSGITLNDNLEAVFQSYNYRFKQLSDLSKFSNSRDPQKIRKAELLYVLLFGGPLPIDMIKVREETKRLAGQIKNVISSVLIRRNRLDLKQDFQYSKELGELSTVRDPEELFYYLNTEQSDFYDRIISEYFIESGRFKGAIYQPFTYETIVEDEDNLDEQGNRAYQQQRNLYDFMRRLLVKRFESSFGAFDKSIQRFIKVHEIVQQFIKSSGGKFIMDRKLMEDIYSYDEDEIEGILLKFEQDLLLKRVPKNNTVYTIDEFQRRDEFLIDIENDKLLFQEIKKELDRLEMVRNDPKRDCVLEVIEKILNRDQSKRKVVLFSEYVDTIKHLEGYFGEKLGTRLLVCDGKITGELSKYLRSDFDAQYKGTQTDFFDVLITSDKLSEGINLNRAGAIINYDIPWNPTRVIQRVGRINRIGKKMFDELYIYNFFPSEAGADIVKSREIASQKMFLIHHALGEDAKIFDPEEEPTPSGLFNRINQSPDLDGELNISTIIRNIYQEIAKIYPDLIDKIKDYPPRVKSCKIYCENQLNVLRRKGLSLFSLTVQNPSPEQNQVEEISFEALLPLVECTIDEPRQPLSSNFWPAYENTKEFKPQHKSGKSEASLEKKAADNLKTALKLVSPKETTLTEFIKVLITDIRKYHTLPSRTLGRIGRTKITLISIEKERKAFFSEIELIRRNLGNDYLERILKRVENQKNEVIIAVENQDKR
ncbi:MAG: helicase-related protein [Saprospiraceae bacterium]